VDSPADPRKTRTAARSAIAMSFPFMANLVLALGCVDEQMPDELRGGVWQCALVDLAAYDVLDRYLDMRADAERHENAVSSAECWPSGRSQAVARGPWRLEKRSLATRQPGRADTNVPWSGGAGPAEALNGVGRHSARSRTECATDHGAGKLWPSPGPTRGSLSG